MTNLIRGGWLSHSENGEQGKKKGSGRDAFLVICTLRFPPCCLLLTCEKHGKRGRSSTIYDPDLVHRDRQADEMNACINTLKNNVTHW